MLKWEAQPQRSPRLEVPNLFGTRDQFCGRQSLHGLGMRVGVLSGWFECITFIVHFTLFLLLLHQFHLRSSGITSWRLGTPVLDSITPLRITSCQDSARWKVSSLQTIVFRPHLSSLFLLYYVLKHAGLLNRPDNLKSYLYIRFCTGMWFWFLPSIPVPFFSSNPSLPFVVLND